MLVANHFPAKLKASSCTSPSYGNIWAAYHAWPCLDRQCAGSQLIIHIVLCLLHYCFPRAGSPGFLVNEPNILNIDAVRLCDGVQPM